MENIQQKSAKYPTYNLDDAIVESINKNTTEENEFIHQLNDLMPLPLGKTTMLSSKGGVGKTTLALKCALTVTRNSNYKVLLHLSENNKKEITTKAKKLSENQLLVPHPKNIQVSDASFRIQKDLFTTNKLNELCEIFKDYKLIIIDPLIKFIDFDENDNKKAYEFIDNLNFIALTNNQAILIVHHHKKGENSDTVARGASAFIDAVRLHYILSKEGTQHKITIAKDNVNAQQFFENKNSDGEKFKLINIFTHGTNNNKQKNKTEKNEKTEKIERNEETGKIEYEDYERELHQQKFKKLPTRKSTNV